MNVNCITSPGEAISIIKKKRIVTISASYSSKRKKGLKIMFWSNDH